MKKYYILLLIILGFTSINLQAQTYVWNRTDSADFQLATNWTPNRNAPAVTDVLVFNSGAVGSVVSNINATQTIAGFQVTNNTFVRITNTHTALISITGGTGPQFSIDAGSTLELAGAVSADSVGFNLATGTTATIAGIFTMKSFGGTPNHRFRVKDAAAANFNNGSVFTFGPAVAGNAFGSAVNASSGNNSVVFNSGSRFISKAGANPFAQSTPNSFVVFNTGSTYDHQQTGAPSVSGRDFGNFDYNNSGTAISSSGAGTFTCQNLTVNVGTFNVNLTGRLNITGDINVASGATLKFFPASSDSIFLNGTSPQNILGAGTLTFANGTSTNKVILNNSNGVTLARNLTLKNLYLQSGNVTLGANTLIVDSTFTGSASSFIKTNGAGSFKLNNVGNVATLFPIGNTTYNPISMTNSGTADNFTVSLKNSIDNPTLDDNHAVTRQWSIAEDVAGGSNCTLILQWGLADEGSSFNRANSLIGHWNGATYDMLTATLGGSNPYTATANNVTAFSPFVVTDDVALPVELASFTSLINSNNVKLSWNTISELNNSGFDVERKNDSGVWNKIGNVSGNGTSNTAHNYSYLDNNLASGKYSYRLKQIDFNGNHKYYDLTNEVIIGTPTKFALSQNYPNPFNPATTISYELPNSNFVSLKVYDMMGREVANLVNANQEAGFYTVKFDASRLSSGIYFYKLHANDFSSTKKLMLLK